MKPFPLRLFCPFPSFFSLLHSLKITANMISEDLVKQRFVHDTISQGINLIYETQENVVRTYLNTRSGKLLGSLQRRPFTIRSLKESKNISFVFSRISVTLTFDIGGEMIAFLVIFEATWHCIIAQFGEYSTMRLSRNSVMATMKRFVLLFARNWSKH